MSTDAKTTRRPARKTAVSAAAEPVAPKSRPTRKKVEGISAAPGAAKPQARRPSSRPLPSAEERHRMVSLAAYYRAEQRGFATGYELQDWLAAEAEVDSLLGLARPAAQ